MLAAVVLAVAGAEKQCPWGQCEDDDISYMNLLQVRADSNSTKRGVSEHVQPTLKKMHPYYHTSTELREEVELLSKDCGGAMTLEKHSDSGVDIDVVHVRSPGSSPKNKVFILFGEHSRELIGPESGLRLLQLICGKATMDGDRKVQNILRESEFQLILNGNPHSRNRVEGGDFCLRTNPNGVDLNRNWDEMWHKGASEGSQTSPGPRPFSEPETRIFKKLVENYQPTTFLTVHSGTRGMYMPWAYDLKHTASYNAPLMLSVLQDLDKTHCQCPFGAAGKEVGYPCPGTCLDWVYSKLRTPYVFAFEIYTSADRDAELKSRWNTKLQQGGQALLQSGSHLGHAHFANIFSEFRSDFVHARAATNAEMIAENDACFSMFNPETEARYNETVQNWAVAYLDMAGAISEKLKQDKAGVNATAPLA